MAGGRHHIGRAHLLVRNEVRIAGSTAGGSVVLGTADAAAVRQHQLALVMGWRRMLLLVVRMMVRMVLRMLTVVLQVVVGSGWRCGRMMTVRILLLMWWRWRCHLRVLLVLQVLLLGIRQLGQMLRMVRVLRQMLLCLL